VVIITFPWKVEVVTAPKSLVQSQNERSAPVNYLVFTMLASRQPFIRPFLLSILVVSALTSKLLHLFQHAGSIPTALLALYFPTFFIQEILLSAATWFLLQKPTGLRSIVGLALVSAAA
jgi:hypothetical protein